MFIAFIAFVAFAAVAAALLADKSASDFAIATADVHVKRVDGFGGHADYNGATTAVRDGAFYSDDSGW